MTPDPASKATVRRAVLSARAAFVLGVLATLLVVAVLLLGWALRDRVTAPELMVFSNRIDLGRIMRTDPDTFWSLEPNLNNVEFLPQPGGPPNSFRVNTNELGLRNPPIGPKAGRYRILCIGDSTTFGQYVEDHESWPAQLQALLDPDADQIEVINAGLIGATSFQGLAYLIHRGFELEPDLVIATYGFNDRGRWNGLQDRDSLPVALPGPLRRLLTDDVATPPSPDAPRVSPGEFLDVYLQMNALCAARGAALHFTVWPGPEQLDGPWDVLLPYSYQSLILEAATRAPAGVIDLRQPLHDAPQPVFADIVHANAHGCRVVAETIAARLPRQIPALQARLPP
jgi:hypothetical protein